MAKTTEDIYKELLEQGKQYQKDADSYLSAYDSRPGFSYNPNADAAYRVMRDQYMHQGQRAMQDTMGQAAGLTGGYNSSYAQAVGNQAYNEYLSKIGGLSVDMAQQARAAYDAEGQRMLDRYNMALNAANNAYAQGRDALADQRYDQERNYSMAMQMIQAGQTPDAALLQAAGIDPGYAQKMAAYYAAQLLPVSGGGSSGGSGKGSGGNGGKSSSNPYEKTPAAGDSDVFKGVKTDILYAAQTGNIAYAYDTLQKNADKLTPEQAKYVQEMLDRLFKQQKTQTNTQTSSGGKGWARAGETRTQNFN